MNLSESMKCGALEPLSRALLCRDPGGDNEDEQVEVQRVAEREVNAKKNGFGQMFSGSNYETFDEGYGEMLVARTFTYDDTCNEDQTTNCDNDESSSAYIPGARAYTYDEESTTACSKPFKTTVAPAQSFIYDALNVEQPQSQVEKQKSLDFEELASFNIATGTSGAAEIVDKSPSDLTRIGLRRTYKGDAISGMEVAFASEDDNSDKTENEEKSAVDDEDDVSERTSLNVTQDSSDSEYGSDSGVEVGIDDVDFMFEKLALELPHDNISTTCSTRGNEEDDISAVLSFQSGTKEKQYEHSDASTMIPRLQQQEQAVAKESEAGAASKRKSKVALRTDKDETEEEEETKVNEKSVDTNKAEEYSGETANHHPNINLVEYTPQEQKWNVKYADLLRYYKLYGTSKIPLGAKTKFKHILLRRWADKQRKAYLKGNLTEDQVEKLAAVRALDLLEV